MLIVFLDHFLVTVSYTIAKVLFKMNDRLSSFEVYAARTLSQMICQELYNYILNKRSKESVNVTEEERSKMSYKSLTKLQFILIIARCMLSYPSWIMIYYSLTIVPMGLVKTILNLVPFLVLIISYFAIKEKLQLIEIVNMIFSFAGSVIIIAFGKTEEAGDSHSSYGLGVFLVTLATCFNAFVYVILRYLKTVHHSIVASF